MSFAPVNAVLSASGPVTSLLGSNPMRCWSAGEARPSEVVPYAVYQQIGGGPENYLNQLPDMDGSTIQFDIYADTLSSARAVFVALRNAVQPLAYVGSVREDGKDPETNRVRISFDVDWLTPR